MVLPYLCSYSLNTLFPQGYMSNLSKNMNWICCLKYFNRWIPTDTSKPRLLPITFKILCIPTSTCPFNSPDPISCSALCSSKRLLSCPSACQDLACLSCRRAFALFFFLPVLLFLCPYLTTCSGVIFCHIILFTFFIALKKI